MNYEYTELDRGYRCTITEHEHGYIYVGEGATKQQAKLVALDAYRLRDEVDRWGTMPLEDMR